jgi:hypothetical protein
VLCKGSAKVPTSICIFTANVSNVLLVGASAGRGSGRSFRTSLKVLVAGSRLVRVSVAETRGGTGSKVADLTGCERNSNVWRVAPELNTRVWSAVCVRFLRTQQRAESQCRNLAFTRFTALDDSSTLGLDGFWVLGCLLFVFGFL